MEEEKKVEFRYPLRRYELDPNRWRSTQAGMWAWLWQRISALAIIVLLAIHVTLPHRPLIQFLLLLAVVSHVTLGLRVILLDFGLVNVIYQKALIGGLAALGAVIFVLVWTGIY
jgi:succinate dehydrogenase / fumarate reductase cytochrome b subunit